LSLNQNSNETSTYSPLLWFPDLSFPSEQALTDNRLT